MMDDYLLDTNHASKFLKAHPKITFLSQGTADVALGRRAMVLFHWEQVG